MMWVTAGLVVLVSLVHGDQVHARNQRVLPDRTLPEMSDHADSFKRKKRSDPMAEVVHRGEEEETVKFGGDMLLTRSQHRILTRAARSTSSRHLFNRQWTNGVIPYTIDPSFSDDQKNWIQRAMYSWEQYTCVVFTEKKPTDTNYVHIRTGDGCFAYMGMMSGEHIVELHKTCFWKGMVAHEFGHTLGLIHEHQRENRDGYIKVNYHAVDPDAIDELSKQVKGLDDKMGLPYDYASVMHYGKFSSSKTGYDQTFFPRDPEATDVIGMSLGPSYIDIKLINMMYNCSTRCSQYPPPSCSAGCILLEDCQCFCEGDMPIEVCEDTDDDCAELAHENACVTATIKMHTKCRKTCGICKTDGTAPQLPCRDTSSCQYWAQNLDCEDNLFMKKNCRKTCNLCHDTPYASTAECRDKHQDCAKKAADGQCDKDPGFMLKNCRQACDQCVEKLGRDPVVSTNPDCQDYDTACPFRKDRGWCQMYYDWMSAECARSCDTCDYQIPSGCRDNHNRCRLWAMDNECVKNPKYMLRSCALSCSVCQQDVKDSDSRCKKWAKNNGCNIIETWMQKNCKKSCART
uniref:Metalloendopeptidase n=1 Tax=Colubraria reticulata TaxID=604273 RepID=A0A481SMK5_9CAEN|nr:CreM12-ShK1 [Colubraria reticulata]